MVFYFGWREVMIVKEHRYESFRIDSARLEESVSDFLDQKMTDDWNVKRCSYRAEPSEKKTWVSCIFEREGIRQGF
jgi:hypothetical protein